ncbi:MAG: cysteine desulfurase-like protein [Deltaproteobacteria bacterium]|nr:cysteine desulfurase-like protein [Deltaproteobacteria bacterium]
MNVTTVRDQFPALQRNINGSPAAYLDGPGGTQAPTSVIDAMSDFLRRGAGNLGGRYEASTDAEQALSSARQAMADFINAEPNEIIFGQNMTSLTFSFSRALSRTWQEGDEIIVTRLDHDANITPWVLAAEDRGVTVRRLDFDPTDCTLDLKMLSGLLNEKTRLLAITHASNAVGSITDVARVVEMAHNAGALVYVDAVHYAPHGLIDVKVTNCDFLACSAYKFFGPHTGILYGKYEHLEKLSPYKLRPAPSYAPNKWETGTQSFESLAGVRAAVDFIASLSDGAPRREKIVNTMRSIHEYGVQLSKQFIDGARSIPGLRFYGITAETELSIRTPTFSIALDGFSPEVISQRLGQQGIFVWDGHYYAYAVMERLGLLDKGGLVRIGFVLYNTEEEVDRVLNALDGF